MGARGSKSFGIKLLRGSGDPLVYAEVGLMEDITPPSESRETIDDTLLSDSDQYKRFVGGMRDAGEFSCVLRYKQSETVHDAMAAEFRDSDEVGKYKVQLPDAEKTEFSYDALITEWGIEAPKDGWITRKVTFKVSGKPTEGVYV